MGDVIETYTHAATAEVTLTARTSRRKFTSSSVGVKMVSSTVTSLHWEELRRARDRRWTSAVWRAVQAARRYGAGTEDVGTQGVYRQPALAPKVSRERNGGGTEPEAHGRSHRVAAHTGACASRVKQRLKPQARFKALAGGQPSSSSQAEILPQPGKLSTVAWRRQVPLRRRLGALQQLLQPLSRTHRSAV